MVMLFWSPSREGQTGKNMSILANILRIQYGAKICALHNYQKAIPRIDQLQKEAWEHVFLDCGNHLDPPVKSLFQSVDTVVVNLPQDEKIIASYFQKRYHIRGNVFYLLNSSPVSFRDGERMCQNLFRMSEEECGAIPYNLRFEQYYEKNLGFFYQNQLLRRETYGMEREFAKKTCEIAVKLLKMNCLFK